jgi:hypothetical protein
MKRRMMSRHGFDHHVRSKKLVDYEIKMFEENEKYQLKQNAREKERNI